MNIKDIRLTIEEMNTLETVKEEITRAFKNNYKRNTTSKQNKLVQDTLGKYGIKYPCNHCPTTNYDMYRQLGRIYYNTLEDIDKQEAITAELTEPINIPTETKPTAKKRGRPKKNNND